MEIATEQLAQPGDDGGQIYGLGVRQRHQPTIARLCGLLEQDDQYFPIADERREDTPWASPASGKCKQRSSPYPPSEPDA